MQKRFSNVSDGTCTLNQAVKRNLKRFPPDFMFQLTLEEAKQMRSQIVTSSFILSSMLLRDSSWMSSGNGRAQLQHIKALLSPMQAKRQMERIAPCGRTAADNTAQSASQPVPQLHSRPQQSSDTEVNPLT
ncbi:MAG: ORF6N domain-containing protein [Bacteroidales bacterium]|nr:ORF6N domain-containing protein [Bacteroidales bacterium]